ncbi:RNA methyltransferase substrate-binding domain-containing protein, partial [Streptococcus pyogenes]
MKVHTSSLSCYNSTMKNKDIKEKSVATDIVYGVHAVAEALQANTGNKLYIQDDLRGKNVEKIKDL